MARKKATTRWIKRALRHHRRGALHRYLRVPAGTPIGLPRLERALERVRKKLKRATTKRQRAALRVRGAQIQFAIRQHSFRHGEAK